MSVWAALARRIGEARGRAFTIARHGTVGGGCINRCHVVSNDSGERYFVKLNRAAAADMFAAERSGLEALGACHALRVPKPLCHGVIGDDAFLVLEHLPLQGRGDERRAGVALATLHRLRGERYGWWRDNTIGATLQPNGARDDWVSFWAEQRLGWQLALAERDGHGALAARGRRLQARLSGLLGTTPPAPSLLHGDLWSGNFAFTSDGMPAVFDPAVYYGDREVDLAMTELFGGFGADFYAAYREAWPLAPGYPQRRTLYNLYHVMNHLHLFGGGYLRQADAMIGELLAELG